MASYKRKYFRHLYLAAKYIRECNRLRKELNLKNKEVETYRQRWFESEKNYRELYNSLKKELKNAG